MPPVAPRLHAPILLVLICASGCADWPLTSKWAMDDPDYRAKYSKPYGNDKTLRMLKQSVDARHVDGKGGGYVAFNMADEPTSVGLEIGGVEYLSSALEGHGGFNGLVGTGAEDWFLGGTIGLRLQSPTRLAPFVGVGAFAGFNWELHDAENDGIDNDDDGAVDELNETKTEYGGLAAVFPEVGVHYWLGSDSRLTLSASRWFTTEESSDDFWFFGIGITVLNLDDSNSEERTAEMPPRPRRNWVFIPEGGVEVRESDDPLDTGEFGTVEPETDDASQASVVRVFDGKAPVVESNGQNEVESASGEGQETDGSFVRNRDEVWKKSLRASVEVRDTP